MYENVLKKSFPVELPIYCTFQTHANSQRYFFAAVNHLQVKMSRLWVTIDRYRFILFVSYFSRLVQKRNR